MENENQIVRVMENHQARLNITYDGQNGDMRDPIPYDASEADIRRWCTEAVQNGDVPGLGAHPDVDFTDFKIDRFGPTETRDHNLIQIRPKVPFGGLFDKLATASSEAEITSAMREAGEDGARRELANDPMWIQTCAELKGAKTSNLFTTMLGLALGTVALADGKQAVILGLACADEIDRRIPVREGRKKALDAADKVLADDENITKKVS